MMTGNYDSHCDFLDQADLERARFLFVLDRDSELINHRELDRSRVRVQIGLTDDDVH